MSMKEPLLRTYSNRLDLPPPTDFMDLWRQSLLDGKMQGWLQKTSHAYCTICRSWKWRYFVLDLSAKTLVYYLDEGMVTKRGEYLLEGESVSAMARTVRGRHQILVWGFNSERDTSKTLYLCAESLQFANFWFAGLRIALRGEHQRIAEMKTYIDSVRIASQALRLRLDFDKSGLRNSTNDFSPSLSSGGDSGSSASAQYDGSLMLSDDPASLTSAPLDPVSEEAEWAKQRVAQLRCRKLLDNRREVFDLLLDRISGSDYTNYDFEISFAQIQLVRECLYYLRSIENSGMLDTQRRLNAFWKEILDIALNTLLTTPACLMTVYVRDGRWRLRSGMIPAFTELAANEVAIAYDLGVSSYKSR